MSLRYTNGAQWAYENILELPRAVEEEFLTRWTLGVQNVLEESLAPPPFPVEEAPSPRGSEPVLERD